MSIEVARVDRGIDVAAAVFVIVAAAAVVLSLDLRAHDTTNTRSDEVARVEVARVDRGR